MHEVCERANVCMHGEIGEKNVHALFYRSSLFSHNAHTHTKRIMKCHLTLLTEDRVCVRACVCVSAHAHIWYNFYLRLWLLFI